jgi:hypothetical protein
MFRQDIGEDPFDPVAVEVLEAFIKVEWHNGHFFPNQQCLGLLKKRGSF